MRVINITIDDKLYDELNSLMTHHGQRMHLLRSAVKRLVRELKEAQLKVAIMEKGDEQSNTSLGPKTQ